MSKIGRNELCPCGSDIKYKKCCGQNNQTVLNAAAVNQELYQAHGDLISFTNNQYDELINKQLDSYHVDETLQEIYKVGLTPWIVLKSSLLENHKTIFQAYMNKKRDTISLHAKQQLLQWMQREPSIYQVITVNEQEQGFAQIQHIAGKRETYSIPFNDADIFSKGSLLSGLIVPFLGHHNFLFQTIRLFNDNKVHFQKLLLKHNHYPTLLKSILEDGLLNYQWLHPLHEEVADLFASYAAEKDYDNKVIAKAIMIWHEYCEIANPSIMKPEPHAAAFAYYFEKDLIDNQDIRQSEVAEQFETSASTLSTTYRRITAALNE